MPATARDRKHLVVTGRPRDPEVAAAAMEAAVSLLLEDGFSALTMERISERAGVSKAALYRRWPNKIALLVDVAADYAKASLQVPDTGTVAGDIVEIMGAFLRKRRRDAQVIEAMMAAAANSPDLARRWRQTFSATFKPAFRTIIERGVARGELPADTDTELLADLAPALVRFRRQATGKRLDDEYIRRIAKQFFAARSDATAGQADAALGEA